MINIPAVINNKHLYTLEQQDICSIQNDIIGKISLFPRIRLYEIQNNVEGQYKKACQMSVQYILESLKEAAEIFQLMEFDIDGVKINKEIYTGLVSMSTGLPKEVVTSEINEIAAFMNDLEKIVAVQTPDGSVDILDKNYYCINGQQIGFYPAGKSLAIKIPGNVPTICVYWLIPLAQKRPIILIPPIEDPFTHFLLFEAIKIASPEVASLITFLPCNESILASLFQMIDQVMISESMKEMFYHSPEMLSKTYFIHYGRSKILIDCDTPERYADAAYRRMTWNCGRTCTGLTSVIVKGDAREFACHVSEKLKNITNDSVDNGCSVVPLFELDRAKKMNEMIEEYIAKGEVEDITEEVRGSARLYEFDRAGALLPTVLYVKKKDSKMFGLELPFPFITVINAEQEELIYYSTNSLILSVVSDDKELINALCRESTILKVFCGDYIERGYNYLDPHEGYIIDFTYQKKAVFV